MTKNTGGPAFPRPHSEPPHYAQEGMTLRDYFAAKALEGLLSGADTFWEDAAPLAYQYADAMLRAREK